MVAERVLKWKNFREEYEIEITNQVYNSLSHTDKYGSCEEGGIVLKMSKEMKEGLISQGVDYNTALERFMGKDDLYERFLVKFLDDENFSKLGENIKAGNVGEAFKCAHTLKGLSGNLGFDNLLEEDARIVEILRSGSLDGVEELYEILREKYQKLCDTIKKCE